MNLSLSEKLTYSTIRIECFDVKGNMSTGTGYFFNFKVNKDTGEHIPTIITNKHVIKNAFCGKLIFCTSKDGEPLNNKHHTINITDFEKAWIHHNFTDVDLCVMPIAQLLEDTKAKDIELFYISLGIENLPKKEDLEDLTALEELIMIGYPNGIWDSYNNKPIIIKGITATHPALDYNNKKEFVIDMACFPGSSGSPVFLLSEGSYTSKKSGSLMIGSSKFFLLGTLYAGPQHNVIGQIVSVPISTKPITFLTIPNNLGFVIKHDRILELEEQFINL